MADLTDAEIEQNAAVAAEALDDYANDLTDILPAAGRFPAGTVRESAREIEDLARLALARGQEIETLRRLALAVVHAAEQTLILADADSIPLQTAVAALGNHLEKP